MKMPPLKSLFAGKQIAQGQGIQTFPVFNMLGGVVARNNSMLLRADQWEEMRNWVPHRASIRKIGGYQQYAEAVGSADARVRGLYEFVRVESGIIIRELIINAGGKTYRRAIPLIMTDTFTDAFTRANNTVLGADWICPGDANPNWRDHFDLDTNKAKAVQASSQPDSPSRQAIAWYRELLGGMDYDVQVDVAFTADTMYPMIHWAGIASRIQDESNYYKFRIDTTYAKLIKCVAGAEEELKTTYIPEDLFVGDGFEAYTAGAEPTDPWVKKAAASNPLVRTAPTDGPTGPDGSANTLQICDGAFDGRVGQSLSGKWPTYDRPVRIQFSLRVSSHAAANFVLFGIRSDSVMNSGTETDLLRFNGTTQKLEFQNSVGWQTANVTKIEDDVWYVVEGRLTHNGHQWSVNEVSGSSSNYPGSWTGHDLEYCYFQGTTHASQVIFVDRFAVAGNSVTVAAVATEILSFDFEDYTVDVQPPNPPWKAGWGETNFRTRNTVAHGGTKSLCVWENIGSTGHNTQASPVPLATLGSYEYLDFDFWIRADNEPNFNYNASVYTLAYVSFMSSSGAFTFGGLYYHAHNGVSLELKYANSAGGYTDIALGLVKNTWHQVRHRCYANKVEFYWNDMNTPLDTYTLPGPGTAAPLISVSSLGFYRYATDTPKIYVDDITVTGYTSGFVGGTEEGTEYTLKVVHRGDRITCHIDDIEVIDYVDEAPGALGNPGYAGIIGYPASTFDNFILSQPDADVEIPGLQIPEGFYDYCTIKNNCIICVHDGQFGKSEPFRYDGTSIVSLSLEGPTTAISAALAGAGAGNVDNGDHVYVCTFYDSLGNESNPSPEMAAAVTVADKTVNGQVSLSSIPTSANSAVIGRKIYRTQADGEVYMLLATISDNSTTTYTDNTADANLTGSEPSFDNDPAPKAAFCCAHGERLFLTGNPDDPDIVYPSKIGYITAFPEELELPVAKMTGDFNTGLHVYNDAVHITKNRAVFWITDPDPDYWRVEKLPFEHGCTSERTIAVIGNALLMQSETQMTAVIGNRGANVSRQIEKLFAEIDPTDMFYSHAVNNTVKKRYELYYRERGNSWPNKALFFHYDENLNAEDDATRIWSGPHDIPCACSEDMQNDSQERVVVAGEVGTDGIVLSLDTGRNFMGAKIISIARSAQLAFDVPDLEKMVRWMYLYVDPLTKYSTLYLQVRRDYGYFDDKTFACIKPMQSEKRRIPINPGGSGRLHRVTFYHDNLNEDFILMGYSIAFQPQVLRR